MTKREFIKRLTNSKDDFLESFFGLLKKGGVSFCTIGGLAVNAYTEPVVSLDLDVVVVADKLEVVIPIMQKYYKVKKYPHSLNITKPSSDIRIQIQLDPRYQPFLKRARPKNVLGYRIPVASIEDVLQGKIWAAVDKKRRPSKRQKDLADIMRLVEARPDLKTLIPVELRKQLIGFRNQK